MDVIKLVESFYEAFQAGDGEFMANAYAKDARFQDPVFTLQGEHIGNMWKMLSARSKGALRIELDIKKQEGEWVHARWQAYYPFSQTKRNVHNIIDARIRIQNGEIIEHYDDFDFWRWSRQALGPIGYLLGWSSFLQNKVQAQAMAGLKSFEEKQK